MSVRWDVDRGTLDPEFAEDVDVLLGGSPYLWVVTYGLRTAEEQQKLYDQGRTTPGEIVTFAPPGHSAHEFGLAVDVCELVDGKENWDVRRPSWPWLWQACRNHPRLHSGHDFPVPDNDHVQAVKWYAVRQQLKQEGKW